MRTIVAILLVAVVAIAPSACSTSGDSSSSCTTEADCPPGHWCVDGTCRSIGDAGDVDGIGPDVEPDGDTTDGTDAGDAGDAPCESGIWCGDDCCPGSHRCAYGGCVIDLGPCESNDDCRGDSWCDEGHCTPYGTPPEHLLDPDCDREIEIGAFDPAEQCRWNGAGDTGPFATWTQVYSAPMVADFDFDDDRAVLAPSIVITTFGATTRDGGILRILDGRTCAQQFALEDPGDRLIYASNNAIGDIDRDGRPEIVSAALAAADTAGGLVAFKYDAVAGAFVRLWYGRRCDLDGEPRHVPNEWPNNNGPSIHDIDDDGVPEILFETYVYDADGCVLNPGQVDTNYLRLGVFSVVADVDDDGEPELVTSGGVWAWEPSVRDWMLEPYWAPPADDLVEATLEGHVAVADMGDFPGAVADEPGRAEIVVASAPSSTAPASSTGRVRVMTIGGEIVFGPFDLPAEPGRIGGRGGPPTIADFDGDPRREFAVAGGSRYTVFDLDETGGILWSRPSQDVSSNVTGSSVFDFDADGVAEVVYADECFLRIYRGTDGEVLFSSARSSGTGYELPVIADVDGDFNSEIVVALTTGVSCPAIDPIYAGDPPSAFVSGTGVVVLRDAEDRWAASRPIWNQHAYAVTNVNDDGTIPRTSDWLRNHADPALNNFRQNVQGALERTGLADLTVALAGLGDLCDAAAGEIELEARVCNRGTNPVPDGARVVFYEGDPDDGAGIACETGLPRLLLPGECTEVSCTWNVPSAGAADSITVVVDPDGDVFECRDGNNRGVIPSVLCGPL
jgi:hypothetical protein